MVKKSSKNSDFTYLEIGHLTLNNDPDCFQGHEHIQIKSIIPKKYYGLVLNISYTYTFNSVCLITTGKLI